MCVDVSVPVAGTIADWPAQIAEPIFKAIEKQCQCRVGWEPRVFFSGCMRNYDVADHMPGAYYLDVQVAEFPTDETVRQWEKGRLH
jgi:hypothetical protein